MDSFSLSDVIPATPDQIFRAWLTGEEHAAFTGSPATSEAMPGGRFTAWDGYIEGTTLELEPNRRILQTWRTTEFPSDAESSLLEVLLVEIPEGTRITLNHNRIPDGQGKSYLSGWKELYFDALKRHFGGATARPAAAKTEAVAKTAPRTGPAKPKAKKEMRAKAARKALKKPKAKKKARAKARLRAKSKVKARPKAKARPKRKPARKSASRKRAKRRR